MFSLSSLWTPAKSKKPPPEEVLINDSNAFRVKLLATSSSDYGFIATRANKVPPALALNFLLYHISAMNADTNKRYKVNAKVWADLLDYCYLNTRPKEALWSRMQVGGKVNDVPFFIRLVVFDDRENLVATAAVSFQHTHWHKAVTEILSVCSPSKKKILLPELRTSKLESAQKWFAEGTSVYMEPRTTKLLKAFEESSSLDDSTFTDDDIPVAAMPRSKIEEKRIVNEQLDFRLAQATETKVITVSNPQNNNNADFLPELPKELEKSNVLDNSEFSTYLPPAPDISDITVEKVSNIEESMVIDESIMDQELVQNINSHPVLQSLLEPDKNESVVEVLPVKALVQAENNVLVEVLKDVVKEYHEKKSYDTSNYSVDEILAYQLNRRTGREDTRQESRKRRRLTYVGNKRTEDFRIETSDLRHQWAMPHRAFTRQDDDYLDYAFYGFVREYGTIVKDIMTLPLGYDFNAQRRGSDVYVRAIHFKNTFTHVTGSKVSGRMIVFYSKLQYSHKNLLGRMEFDDIKTEDILQKSVTMYAGDLEEMDAADVFYNPTIMSQYDFRNIVLGNKFQILYDYYVDLNTTAVKGVVGEDIESVDSIKTKWVKLDDLDLPFFYDGEDKIPTRGMIGVLFMGDYFGGEIETNMTMRVFYNSK